MVVLNEGKNRIRDLLQSDLDSGEHGTNSTAVSVTDTGLGTAVSATNASLTSTTGDKTLNTTHIMTSLVGNGTTFYEYVVKLNSGSTDFSRSVYPAFAKTSDEELHTTVITRVK